MRVTCWLSTITAAALLASLPARADDSAEDKAYKAITDIVQVAPRDQNSDDCNVKGTADFAKYMDDLPIFRDAFLNHDYSVDFYNQRRKQVFVAIVLKRAAELITEGFYHGHTQPECHFSFTVAYPDKFGQTRSFEALTWRFNNEQAAKVNWEKFDPRDFQEIALDYSIKPKATSWFSDEPKMGGDSPTPASAASACDPLFFNANAMFIRATTFCRKDYMDSPEGLAALEGARKCQMSEAEMKAKTSSAMLTLDKIARQRGKAAVCPFVEEVAREVRAKMQ